MQTILDFGPFSLDSWTLLGRGPLVAGLVLLTLWARSVCGTRTALLALMGFCAGLSLGTWLLPSVIGATLGGALAWTLVLRTQGETRSSAIPLALFFLGVVFLGRFGCFVNGCCFGIPSDAAWALSYPAGSLAHHTHLTAGWLGTGADHSLALHPVQLYEAIFLVGLAGALMGVRRWLRHDFAATLVILALYLGFRGVMDPLRGMVNTESSLVAAGGLSHFRWLMLGSVVCLLASAFWWVRKGGNSGATVGGRSRVHPGAVWFAATLCVSATHTSLPPLFHTCALATLALSGAYLVWAYSRAARGVGASQRRTAVAVGLVLLSPVALHAWDGDADDTARKWIYGVDLNSGRLVRIGDQSTLPSVLDQKASALAGPSGGGGPGDARSSKQKHEARPFVQLSAGGSTREYGVSTCGGPAEIFENDRLGFSAAFERPADRNADDFAGHMGQRFELAYTMDQWRHSQSYDEDNGRGLREVTGTSHELNIGYWGLLHYQYGGLGIRLSGTFEGGTEPPNRLLKDEYGAMRFPAFYGYVGVPALSLESGLAAPFQPTAVQGYWPFLGLSSHLDWGTLRGGLASTASRFLASAEVYFSAEVFANDWMRIGGYLGLGGGGTLLLTTSFVP